MTQAEIVKETIEYYSKNPRSIGELDVCMYLNPLGNKCAFARCCTNKGVDILHKFHESKSVNHFDDPDDFLKPEYKGHDQDFWRNLQYLHDVNEFWVENENGGSDLTHKGKDRVFKYFNINLVD